MHCLSYLAVAIALVPPSRIAGAPLNPTVEIEENVYNFEPANNGAGPMWCSGSTCLIRTDKEVFASGLETLKEAKPLNNCRWTLWRRNAGGWSLVQADARGRTREPSPLGIFSDGRIVLSANPTLTTPDTYNGPAEPQLLFFQSADLSGAPELSVPEWNGHPRFTEHSYRSLAIDGPNRELILLQNIDYTHAEWALRDRHDKWVAQGQLKWPWGAEYDKPEPIRICYPNVALKDRAVHFVGVSDVVEPYEKWRQFKKELTGREWDYDFRRLFYTWSPDIASGKFNDWIELASRDKTCGWISPGDLHLAPDGTVHIIWTERALDERLRQKFFPDLKQRHELNYAILRNGKVISRRTLASADEGKSNEIPGQARFQLSSDRRLFVFYYVYGNDSSGKPISENRVMELLHGDSAAGAVKVPLSHALSSFFTGTPRAGSPPSDSIDLLGIRTDSPQTISYARVRLH